MRAHECISQIVSINLVYNLPALTRRKDSVSNRFPEMNGQKVLVTGAGAGIGRGLTKSLLEMGAEVFNRITNTRQVFS